MSTGLPNGPDGEQQLGINPGSPDGGHKWALTHVHRAQPMRSGW